MVQFFLRNVIGCMQGCIFFPDLEKIPPPLLKNFPRFQHKKRKKLLEKSKNSINLKTFPNVLKKFPPPGGGEQGKNIHPCKQETLQVEQQQGFIFFPNYPFPPGGEFFPDDGEGFQVFAVFRFFKELFSLFVLKSGEVFQEGGGIFSRFGKNIHPW